MSASARRFFLETVAGRGGLGGALARPCLALLEPLYAWGVRRRARAYREGRKVTRRAPFPVVSVGNLSVGGTGKTPMVEWIARRAQQEGLKAGVLCRGYGGASAEGGLNDEARWLLDAIPGLLLVADPDRARGAERLAARGAAAAILDDGFQHMRLARDLDVVLLDATRPFGHGHLLPRGLLREPPEALERASMLVITRCEQATAPALAELEERIGELAPGRPIYRSQHRPAGWIDAGGEHELPALQPGPVGLISALGRPDAFERTVGDLGFQILEHRVFPDHHDYRVADLAMLDDAPRWLTTTKDWVKLRALRPERIHALRIEIAFEDEDPWSCIGSVLRGEETPG